MPENTQEYKIEKADITAEHEFGSNNLVSGSPIDIKNMIGEISLFEDLQKGYITAQIGFLDDIELVGNILKLQGREKIELEIKGVSDSQKGDTLKIKLRIVSIVKQKRITDKSAVYNINCISEYAYADALCKVSKSYNGRMEDTAESILKDYLNVSVTRTEEYLPPGEKSHQGDVSVIIPYISPLESLYWLIERCTDELGLPWFAWAGLWDWVENDETIFYGTFKRMAEEGIANASGDETMQFYASAAPVGTIPTAKNEQSRVLGLSYENIENTLEMINKGTVGSTISSIDLYTSQKMNRHFDLDKFIDHTFSDNATTFETIRDGEDKVTIQGEEKTPSEFDARIVNTITSYGTQGWRNGYHDNFDPADLYKKISSKALMDILKKNKVDMTFLGYRFLKYNHSIGDVLKIAVVSAYVDEESRTNKIDERMSGYYMIIGTRHIFRGNTHRVNCSLAKLKDYD
jgi:hypothetical protein